MISHSSIASRVPAEWQRKRRRYWTSHFAAGPQQHRVLPLHRFTRAWKRMGCGESSSGVEIKGITFSVMCLFLCFVSFSCLQISFNLPHSFCLVSSHSKQLRTSCGFVLLLLLIVTLFCHFTDACCCEGQVEGQSRPSVTCLHTLLTLGRLRGSLCSCGRLKGRGLSALFQALRVPTLLRRDRIQTL